MTSNNATLNIGSYNSNGIFVALTNTTSMNGQTITTTGSYIRDSVLSF